MSDLSTILPAFTAPSPAMSELLSAIEALPLTTADILSLDALDISRRLGSTSRSSVLDIKRFIASVASAFHNEIGASASNQCSPDFITTGDAGLDNLLAGGIPTRCITEFVGESGAGKSQFLLTLTLTTQLPPHLGGLSRPSVYISTEAPLSTKRLFQLATALSARSTPNEPISTDRVYSITCNDLETQEHIIRYQLPILVEKYNIGLIVIDSVAANFRVEFERPVKRQKTSLGESTPVESGPAQMARRGKDLVNLAKTLRGLASKYNLAVVVANQVSDRFANKAVAGGSLGAGGGGEGGSDEMGLDFQARWFSGWGESGVDEDAKVPALGLVWANQLAARVVLRKEVDEGGDWRRKVKVVFASWARSGVECGFEIVESGVKAVVDREDS